MKILSQFSIFMGDDVEYISWLKTVEAIILEKFLRMDIERHKNIYGSSIVIEGKILNIN